MGVVVLNFLKRLFNFIFRFSERKTAENEYLIEEKEPTTLIKEFENESTFDDDDEKINISRRTLLTRLYMAEQQISIIQNEFPQEYTDFINTIELLREDYNETLQESMKELAFEIDPEDSGMKLGKVLKLERDINKFLEKEFKFSILSKRMKKLIKAMNIMYNVSIFNIEPYEREKILSKLTRALKIEEELIYEFKQSDYILKDRGLKEKMIELISYLDYEMFKIAMRSSQEQKPINELIEKLAILREFRGFEYEKAFKAYIQKEVLNLTNNLIPLIEDTHYQEKQNRRVAELLQRLIYVENNDILLENLFWNDYLDLETNLLMILKLNGISKEICKVQLIINIDIDEDEVLNYPKDTTMSELINIFSKTHDEKILLVIKVLENISKDITYKEIYFLLLLFDVIEIIQTTPNAIIKNIGKYIEEYPYGHNKIEKKKNTFMKQSSNKGEYIYLLSLDDYDKQSIIEVLKKLNMDMKVEKNNVLINSFYFQGLDNVLRSLKQISI